MQPIPASDRFLAECLDFLLFQKNGFRSWRREVFPFLRERFIVSVPERKPTEDNTNSSLLQEDVPSQDATTVVHHQDRQYVVCWRCSDSARRQSHPRNVSAPEIRDEVYEDLFQRAVEHLRLELLRVPADDPRFHVVAVSTTNLWVGEGERSVAVRKDTGTVASRTAAAERSDHTPHEQQQQQDDDDNHPRKRRRGGPARRHHYRRAIQTASVAYRVTLCQQFDHHRGLLLADSSPRSPRGDEEELWEKKTEGLDDWDSPCCAHLPFSDIRGPLLHPVRCVCLRRLLRRPPSLACNRSPTGSPSSHYQSAQPTSEWNATAAVPTLLKWYNGNQVKAVDGTLQQWSKGDAKSICLNPVVFADALCDLVFASQNDATQPPVERRKLIRFLRAQGVALQSPLTFFPEDLFDYVLPLDETNAPLTHKKKKRGGEGDPSCRAGDADDLTETSAPLSTGRAGCMMKRRNTDSQSVLATVSSGRHVAVLRRSVIEPLPSPPALCCCRSTVNLPLPPQGGERERFAPVRGDVLSTATYLSEVDPHTAADDDAAEDGDHDPGVFYIEQQAHDWRQMAESGEREGRGSFQRVKQLAVQLVEAILQFERESSDSFAQHTTHN